MVPLLYLACAPKVDPQLSPQAKKVELPGSVAGPDLDTMPLWRPRPGADKIYVEADVGDGVPRLFLVDTGAAITVVSGRVEEALGLSTEDPGHMIVGLGGRTRWRKSKLEAMTLGDFTVTDVHVAVDVPGVPTQAGLVPVDGIIGNNVWGHFTMVVDYPADTLTLRRPGTWEVPSSAEPMLFDGEHATTGAELVAERDGTRLRQTVLLEIDTGARGLIVDGVFGNGLESVATQGEELIFGIGAGDDLPASQFMRNTRRIPLVQVVTGGRTVKKKLDATWLNYDGQHTLGPLGMPGLLGHTVMSDYQAVLDFQQGRFALTPSQGDEQQNDMHTWYLHQLETQEGEEARFKEAELLAWLDRPEAALNKLDALLADDADSIRGNVLQARMLRRNGETSKGLALLVGLGAAALVEQREIISTVNAMWLDQQAAAALVLAQQGVDADPTAAGAWIALADAKRFNGDLAGARLALSEANRLEENPDGHLLRRAWIATDEGDTNAAITHVRRLMSLYPSGGVAPWFYSLQVAGTAQEALFLQDLEGALARLHPRDQPFDFLAAAYVELGLQDDARSHMDRGRERDCELTESDASKRNCEAWYLAMSKRDLPEARRKILAALEGEPHRPEFLDTFAVLALAQGNVDEAHDAAKKAAAMVPNDVYLLWQAARIEALAQR